MYELCMNYVELCMKWPQVCCTAPHNTHIRA